MCLQFSICAFVPNLQHDEWELLKHCRVQAGTPSRRTPPVSSPSISMLPLPYHVLPFWLEFENPKFVMFSNLPLGEFVVQVGFWVLQQRMFWIKFWLFRGYESADEGVYYSKLIFS